jgi:hypothetical protein
MKMTDFWDIASCSLDEVDRRFRSATAYISPCGICGGQSGTGTGSFTNSSAVLSQYHTKVPLQTRISPGG